LRILKRFDISLIAHYAYHASLAGQPLFGRASLED